ncbi:TonB-dependent receptor domain-containing protein [Oleiharenicola sp. Vm1]|uniref:TonB-dependent receptor domain-containing protein n=1 Tax=Oleiharenicola sp. Vm1 TaxID=3398393 RepID=UPI0039F579AB
MAFAATLIAVSATAQTPATGTIRGTITNATNGQTLENVVLRLTGSGKQAISNSYGDYEFTNVPAGEVEVRASYVGESDLIARITVVGGETARKDFLFREKEALADNKDGTITLNPYTVNAERYNNARAIAIASERNAVNIKNVVSTDTFGEIPGGNVGEFVKFLPGVQVDYGAYGGAQAGYSEGTASGVSVRGFGPEDTAILIDGMPVSNATPGSLTRQVGLDMLSINNASRVELIKVATPDMPANSQGGQINLITKSAFEFTKPSYNVRLYANYNSLQPMTLKKTPGPVNKSTTKLAPGVDFSATYPFTKTFGVTVTGYANRQYDQTYRAETTASTSGSSSITNSSGAISLTNPAITRFKVTDTPRLVESISGNFRADWRPTPNQTLTGNIQYSKYNSAEAQRRLDFRPTFAAGADWGPTFTKGTTANSTTDMTVTTIDKIGDTKSGYLQYRFVKGGWNISASASLSVSNSQYRDQANGHFSEIALKLNPGQVVFNDLVNGIPTSITTYNRTSNGGGVRDYTNLSNYSLDGTIAKSAESYARNTVGLYRADVSRTLDFIPWLGSNSLSFATGIRRDAEKNEKWGRGTGYRRILDTTKSSLYSIANILDDTYLNVSPGFGYPGQQWGSSYKLYELDQANQLFVEPGATTADARENWYSYVGQQKNLTETRDGIYAMLSGSFLKGRLSFVGGARQEQNTRKGRGPFIDGKWYFAKNADGTLYRDSVLGTLVDFRNTTFLGNSALLGRMASAKVWYPDHAIPASGATPTGLEGAQLARRANYPVNQKQTGDPAPSLSVSYQLTKKIDLKAAWSRSFGMPKLEDGINGVLSNQFNVTENDVEAADGTLGTISVANPGIKASTSTNWDFQVSYYTDTGGKLSVSYWTKSVTNQSETTTLYYNTSPELFSAVLDALGLDAESYQRYKLTTSSNSDSVQKTHGFEYEVRQDFAFLGGWGRNFQVFASYSANTLGTPATPTPVVLDSPNGSPVTFTPTVSTITLRSNRFWGAGLQFASSKLTAQIRAAYKNDNEISGTRTLIDASTGNYLRRFEPAVTRVDVSASYKLSKNYSLFLSGKDVFNAERSVIVRDDLGTYPAYAQAFDLKRFGVTWTFGVSGSW